MSATFNAAKDLFKLETATQNKVKVVSMDENRSNQTANGQNTYGDVKAVDQWGETAAPSCTYEVVGDIDSSTFANKGGSIISEPDGFTLPLCFGGLSFTTGDGQVPTITVNGQLVQADATQLRKYSPVAFKISPRHRAQNCVGTLSGSTFTPAISIKKGSTEASDIDDYGLSSVGGDVMPIEITIAQPKGVTMNHDLHGGVANIQYSMQWYGSTAPTISLSAAAIAAGFTFAQVPTKGEPKDGYDTYTWAIQCPMVGVENTTPAAT